MRAMAMRAGEEAARALFDPGRMEVELMRDLPAALRALAASIEGGQIQGAVWGVMAAAGRGEDVELRVTLALSAPVWTDVQVASLEAVSG